MVISYVLRLRPDALAEGRFVGEIEAVTSQQRTRISTLDQMTMFILASMESQVSSGSTARKLAMESRNCSGSTNRRLALENRDRDGDHNGESSALEGGLGG